MTDSGHGVLHVYKGYPPVRGGIEGHVDLLTRRLVEHGTPAHVLCARPHATPATEARDGVQVRRCRSVLTLASTPLPPTLPWWLHANRASVIHLHQPWPPGDLAYLLGGRGRPLVVTVHCEVIRQRRLARLLSPLTRTVLARARRIIVTGAHMRNRTFLRPFAERVRVVPLGVDLQRFRPGSTEDPFPDLPHPRIVFVGRFRHYKGLPLLAAALARLPAVRLIAVGDGPERLRFEAALHDAGCRDRAHLPGEVDDEILLRILRSSDAAVLASTSAAEAFGLAIAEAQACGLPAVTTEVGTATAATVDDGISGRVAPPADPDVLAEALSWCLDPVRAPTLRAAARRHAEEHLDAQHMTEQVLAIYREAAEPRPPRIPSESS